MALPEKRLATSTIQRDLNTLIDEVDDITGGVPGAADRIENASGEGAIVDSGGTITIKLGDNAGVEKVSITDVDDAEVLYFDSDGGTNLSHDALPDFVAAEHIAWADTGAEDVHADRITEASVTQHVAAIDHDSLLNFLAAEHVDWAATGAEDVHDDRIPSSNVTQHVGDIDHDALLNFVANEHIDWTSTAENLNTSGTGTIGGGTTLGTSLAVTLADSQKLQINNAVPAEIASFSEDGSAYILGNLLVKSGTATGEWWDLGDASCLGAWKAVGVATLAASKVDQTTNGNDLSGGSDPGWDTVNGWDWNGTTQYLETGITIESDFTIIYRFSDVSGTYGHICGVYKVGASMALIPDSLNDHRYIYGYTSVDRGSAGVTEGVMALAANQPYLNGVADGAAILDTWNIPDQLAAFIGASNTGTGINTETHKSQALAIYNRQLTSDEVAAIGANMLVFTGAATAPDALRIQNDSGIVVSSIDNEGQALFAGDITEDGALRLKEIAAPTLIGGYAKVYATTTGVYAKTDDGTAHYLTHNLTTDIDHDALTNFVAAEHIDWSDTGAEDVHVDRIAAGAVTQHVASIDHDATLNFVAAEHVSLPNTLANVLSDHDLAAHTTLGLFDQHADVDHDQTTNFVAAEHVDWAATGAEDVHVDRIAAGAVTQHVGSIDHDSLLNFAANEHVVLPGTLANVLTDHDLAAHTALGLFDASGDVDHDATTNYVGAEHLVLPNTLVQVLTDHNLAAHTALGLFDAAADVDHDATTNFVANEHIDWTNTSEKLTTTGGASISGNLRIGDGFLYLRGSTDTNHYIEHESGSDKTRFGSWSGWDFYSTQNTASGFLLTHAGHGTLNEGLVINEGGNDSDTRIEGANDTHLLFVDAGTDRIGINHDAPIYRLDIYSDQADAQEATIAVERSYAGVFGPYLRLRKSRAAGAAVSDGDELGTIIWNGTNDAVTPEWIDMADLRVAMTDASDGTEDAEMRFQVKGAGTFPATPELVIKPAEVDVNGDLGLTGDVVVNRNSTDYTGYVYVPLTTPLLSTAFDGDAYTTSNDQFTVDTSVSFGAPAGIKAADVDLIINPSAAGADAMIGPSSTYYYAVQARGQVASVWNNQRGICPCDANGDFYFQVTANVSVYIRIWGYYI